MPLLQVAILLGCSCDIITTLIRHGARVGTDEVRLAADVGDTKVLSALLHYTQYLNGTVDLSKCSPSVSAAINEAVDRQELQRKSLRTEVESFLIHVLPLLIDLGLKSRRQQSRGNNNVLGRSIAIALVGNVELCALKKKETLALTSKSKRCTNCSPKGLLQILPINILGRCLTEDKKHLTALLLMIEDWLCSKSMIDAGFAMLLLSTLLDRFPSLNTSPEFERFGFAELVSSHEALAEQHLSSLSCDHDGIMFCPEKHEAQLHITKHSSFRCDLCGRSIERGEIM
jgi:hypothetical protein